MPLSPISSPRVTAGLSARLSAHVLLSAAPSLSWRWGAGPARLAHWPPGSGCLSFPEHGDGNFQPSACPFMGRGGRRANASQAPGPREGKRLARNRWSWEKSGVAVLLGWGPCGSWPRPDLHAAQRPSVSGTSTATPLAADLCVRLVNGWLGICKSPAPLCSWDFAGRGGSPPGAQVLSASWGLSTQALTRVHLCLLFPPLGKCTPLHSKLQMPNCPTHRFRCQPPPCSPP